MLKSIILTSLIFTIPLEIVENTTLSSNNTTMYNQSICPAFGNLTKPETILLDKNPSFRRHVKTNKDTGTAKELSKLTKMITELVNSSRSYFENYKIEIVEKIIRITNQSVNESSREIHKLWEESMRELNNFQQNVTFERKQLETVIRDLFHQCQNGSKIEILKLQLYIDSVVQSSQKCFIEELGQSTENISNFINKFHINLNDRIQNLQIDMQTSFKTIQDQFVDETTDLGVHVTSEVQTIRWMLVCIIAIEVLLFVLWCGKGKSRSRQKAPDLDISEPVMENSVAVVSFSERNKDLHLKLALSVISSFEIHQVYLGGMTNISTIGLPSKVCLVFVDKNERNIILETDVDVSRTRASFVEGQIKKGRTQVIVIYCQHAGSHNMTRLYDRSLGNINKQETLRQLQRQNRVLSIDKEFSEYQSNHLKTILNEALC